jgi:formate-nitrite transporter family protein
MSEDQEKIDEEAEERSAPSAHVVHASIRREGESELKRPSSALAWSGLAAGLSMGFSFLAEALLRHHLLAAAWQPLLTKLGYSVGFLIVILGRQQLFTENTLTVILPLLQERKAGMLRNVLRLWTVVLLANLAGGLLFALVAAKTEVFDRGVLAAMHAIGAESLGHSFSLVLLRAIFAGWLIALMVWLLPFAESARFWVIVFLTYLVGLGHFPHIVAGAVDVFFMAWSGDRSWSEVTLQYLLPTLLGNIIGGVALVAALAHAQTQSGPDDVDG